MKKVFIVLTGVYLLILGCFLILSVGMLFLSSRFSSAQFPPNFNPLLIVFIYLPFIAWLFATGIALFLYKNWARISLLVMSGLAIFAGLCMALVVTLMPMPDTGSGSSSVAKVILLICTAIFTIALPIVYFIFFTRKSVVELFKDPMQPVSELKRPVGISILAILSLFGVMMTIVNIFFNYNKGIPIFGSFFLTGWGLQLYFGVMAVINLFIAYGLWKLLKAAWYTYMGLMAFGIINCFISFFTYNEELLLKMTMTTGSPQMVPLMFFKIILGISVIFIAFIMFYLYTQRVWFKVGGPKNNNAITQSE